MMNLSANMDLRDVKDNFLAKAYCADYLFSPPAKAGDNLINSGFSPFHKIQTKHTKLALAK